MTRILINACNAELRRRKRELAVAEPRPPRRPSTPPPGRPLPACPVSCGRWWSAATSGPHPGEETPALDIRRAPYPPANWALSLLKLHLTEEV